MAGDGVFRWYWQTGTGDCPETYQGPCDTRDEAIATARSDDGIAFGFVIVEADREVPRCDIFQADRVLDDYTESNEECWGEDGADVQCTSAQERDLEAMLAATFDAWFKKHDLSQRGWSFSTLRNQETFQPAKADAAE